MTKLEALKAVLEDSTRSTDDREIAIKGLRRMTEYGDHAERVEAQKILATLPPTQEEQDHKLVVAVDYNVPLTELRLPQPPPPWSRYDPTLQELIWLLRGDPCLWPLAARTAGKSDAEYAMNGVSKLKALHASTGSDRIRSAVIDSLTKIAKQLDDAAARQDAATFLSTLPQRTHVNE